MKLEDVTHKHFDGLAGQKFSIQADGVDTVELISVEVKPPYEGAKQTPFVLTFRGPADVVLEQSIYALEHDSIGKLEIFLVPVGQTESEIIYEAVFN